MSKNKKTITFEIDISTGEVKAEAHGYEGQTCARDLDPLLEGLDVKKRTPKRERSVSRQRERNRR